MRFDVMNNESEKWKEVFNKLGKWSLTKQKKIQKLEAEHILAWLFELDLEHYDILELGCGSGNLGKIISKGLLEKNKSFQYHFTDLIEECISLSKYNLKDFSSPENLKFSVLNATELTKVFNEKSQKIIISTGFASVATYKHIVPLVSKVLEDDGILITDFINHFSPSVFLATPFRNLHKLSQQLRKIDRKSYHFGKLGIKQYFETHNLHLQESKTLTPNLNPLLYRFKKNSHKV